ncbi:MAG: alpha/beta hydrolase [Balneolaceae bacterium]|nr:alpha/beta hydrolase [Balneolaceae bacterium]
MIYRFALMGMLILTGISCTQNKPVELVNPVLAVTGKVIEHDDFSSNFVDSRNIEVWLPEGYDAEDDRYQVLYMHDGQNVFDPNTSYNGNDWMVDEALTELIAQNNIEKTIVVAIWNSGITRFPEYMPQKPANVMNSEAVQKSVIRNSGKAIFSDDYLKFIVEELKPFIDANYRTKPEREHTSIMGSSMGGLISLYAIMEYPEVFGSAGCLSTHWTVPEIGSVFVEYLDGNLPDPATHKIYFDYGTLGLDAYYEPFQQQVDSIMIKAGYEPGKNWVTKKFEGHDHKEQYWAMRISQPLTFLLD